MKRAIITGITGQDGAYLSRLLLEKNYKVIGVSRKVTPKSFEKLKYLGIDDKILIIECDLTDLKSVKDLLRNFVPNEFYNLAAQSSVGFSFEQPIETINYNISSITNILEAIRQLGLDTKLYQASSSEMFGSVQSLPISLNSPMHPVSPYAISKATGYWLSINYRESYNLYVSNGILFNHESYLRDGNFFVKKVIRNALLIKDGYLDKLTVGNIDIKRDMGYAPKYVEAMWLSLQQEFAADYLICSGKSVSLREIIYYVFDSIGIERGYICVDKSLFRPSEIENIYGDNSLSKQKLKWVYDYSFFEVLDILIEEEKLNYLKNR